MNLKTTGILLALLVAAGLIWLFAPLGSREATGPSRSTTTPEPLKKVLDPPLDAEKVTRVQIERPGQPALVFERVPPPPGSPSFTPAEWNMVAPLSVPAEGFQVMAVVRALTDLQAVTQFEPGAAGQPTASDAGLDPPATAVVLTPENGTPVRVEIGRKAVMSTDTYVRVAGKSTIYVGQRDLAQVIKKDPTEYRSKRLASFRADDVVAAVIRHGGRTYDLTRGADNEWILNSPVRAPADREKVRTLLTRLANLRAETFVADNDTDGGFGFDPAFLAFTVTTETRPPPPPATQPEGEPPPETQPVQRTFGLVVGGTAGLKADQRYARLADQPWVVTVTTASVNDLVPTLTGLRDRRIVPVRAAAVTRLEITAAGQSAAAEKVDGRWQAAGGDLGEVDAAAITEILDALEALRAEDYSSEPADPVKHGLATPRTTLTVTASGVLAPLTLRIGNEARSGHTVYVQRDGDPTVIVTTRAQVEKLVTTPLALRSRDIFRLAPDQIQRVAIQRGDRQRVAVRGETGWTLAVPPDAPLATDRIPVLLADLARLRATKVVGRVDEARFGLQQPTLTVTFDVVHAPQALPPDAPQAAAAAEPSDTPPAAVAPPADTPEAGTTPADAVEEQTPPADAPATATPQVDTPPADEASPDAPPATPPAAPPVVPPAAPTTHTLRVARVDNATYAQRDDEPFVFELDETVYRTLAGELIAPRVLTVDADRIVTIAIRGPDLDLEFVRDGTTWKYAPEPYLELDQAKALELPRLLANLQAVEFIAYRGGDLAQTGLASAPYTVAFKLPDGSEPTLKIAAPDPDGQALAALVPEQRIFRISAEDREKLLRNLDAYLKSAGPAAQPGAPPPLGGAPTHWPD